MRYKKRSVADHDNVYTPATYSSSRSSIVRLSDAADQCQRSARTLKRMTRMTMFKGWNKRQLILEILATLLVTGLIGASTVALVESHHARLAELDRELSEANMNSKHFRNYSVDFEENQMTLDLSTKKRLDELSRLASKTIKFRHGSIELMKLEEQAKTQTRLAELCTREITKWIKSIEMARLGVAMPIAADLTRVVGLVTKQYDSNSLIGEGEEVLY